MAVGLQKIITLELHNVTISTVGSEMDIDLAKGFNNTMSDFTKPQTTGGWQTYTNITLMSWESRR